jgi:large subunit ribosomal protein L18
MQFRRRREQKTDYGQRLALLKSGKTRLVVRRSNKGFIIQFVEFQTNGDKTVLEVSSSCLKKFGWKGHCGGIPSAYLTGVLAGKKALKFGITEVVPDLGMQISVKGSSLYACLSGAKDAGIKLAIGKDILPDKSRIEGRHIAKYASDLKSSDKSKYARHFSQYIKNGLEPEKLPEHFKQVLEQVSKGE